MKKQTFLLALSLIGLSALTAKADFGWRPITNSNSGATETTKQRLRADERRWIKHKDDMDDPNDKPTCIDMRIVFLQSQSR